MLMRGNVISVDDGVLIEETKVVKQYPMVYCASAALTVELLK